MNVKHFDDVLDMGCGCGIFGLFLNEKLKIHNKTLTNLVFADIDQIALNSAYVNCNLNKQNLTNINNCMFV